MKKKRKLKKKFVVFFTCYFLLITSVFFLQTYSKFSSSVDKTGNMSVAKWNVSSNIPDANITIEPVGEDNSYELTVTNNSEVSVSYSIKFSKLATCTYVSINGDNGTKYSNGGNSFTFNNDGTINANDSNKTKSYKIKFMAAPEVIESTKEVQIDVIFTQVNPN